MSLRSLLTHILTVRTERGISVLDVWQEGWFSSQSRKSLISPGSRDEKETLYIWNTDLWLLPRKCCLAKGPDQLL